MSWTFGLFGNPLTSSLARVTLAAIMILGKMPQRCFDTGTSSD